MRTVFCRTLRTVSSLMVGGIPAFTITLFLPKTFPSLLANAWFVVRYFSFVEHTVLVVFPDYSFVTFKSPIFFFHMLADGCFWILPVWSHIWYFWISLSCILMKIAPVNGYIQWNSLQIFNQIYVGIKKYNKNIGYIDITFLDYPYFIFCH